MYYFPDFPILNLVVYLNLFQLIPIFKSPGSTAVTKINVIKLNFTIIKTIISTRNKISCHLLPWTLQYMLRMHWFQIYFFS